MRLTTCRAAVLPMVLAVLLATTGCSQQNHAEEKTEKGDVKKVEKQAEGKKAPLEKPDFTLTAVQFSEEQKSDFAAAGRKYDNKVVELTGPILLFARHPLDPKGPPAVTLGEFRTFDLVLCYTMDKAPWLRYSLGQTATVRGRVNGNLLVVNDAEIVAAKGDPPVEVSVARLIKELDADPKTAASTYDNKILLLSGEFDSSRQGTPDLERLLTLKTDGKRTLECDLRLGEDAVLKGLKAGDQVTIMGRLAGAGPRFNDGLSLKQAIITAAPTIAK